MSALLLLGLIFLALLLVAWVIRHPAPSSAGSRVLTAAALVLLPTLASLGGVDQKLEQSKQTGFCLSCHEMEPYGRSLWLDDPSLLPASHFQNTRIPRDLACYTCHTSYTLYGDLAAKWGGLQHLAVHYLGDEVTPGSIELYRPYRNRECLRCHDGARSFLEGGPHAGMLSEIRANEISCLDCHGGGHGLPGSETRVWHPTGDAAHE